MTTLREAAQMALDALTCTGEHDDPGHRCGYCDDYVDRNGLVRAALRAALEEQPVAWRYKKEGGGWFVSDNEPQYVEQWNDIEEIQPLYATTMPSKH